jgi:RNA ligase
MVHVGEVVDPEALARAVADGLVAERRHPAGGLSIFNYTSRCAWERAWDTTTRRARGLIVADDGTVGARPFPKFFNWGEPDVAVVDGEPVEISHKLDGSLGIAYRDPTGRPAVATRGSFDSTQAQWATGWLRRNHPGWEPATEATALFEIIYPENRVVVDYGGHEGLTLLAVIDERTGADLPLARSGWPGAVVEHTTVRSVDDLLSLAETASGTEAEGWVLRFAGDGPPESPTSESPRLKVKIADYVRRHRILTGLDTVRVWELLASGGDPTELASIVPDEWYRWVAQVAGDLRDAHAGVLHEVEEQFALIPTGLDVSRREQAEVIKALSRRSLLFRLLDSKPVEAEAWKLVRPERSAPDASRRLDL